MDTDPTAHDKAQAAGTAYDKAQAAYVEAWTARDKAQAAYAKAQAAYAKARTVYDEELNALVCELVPDSQWNGKTIFLKEAERCVQ